MQPARLLSLAVRRGKLDLYREDTERHYPRRVRGLLSCKPFSAPKLAEPRGALIYGSFPPSRLITPARKRPGAFGILGARRDQKRREMVGCRAL